jgi:hypothetical protein
MKNIKIVFLLIFTPIIYGMDNPHNNSVYKEISKEIINSCLKNKIESLVVLPFENKNNVEAQDIEYFFEKLLLNLQSQNKIFVYENSLIKKIGVKEKPDAFVVVKVFWKEEEFKIIYKLVRLSDGSVLIAGEGDIKPENILPIIDDSVKLDLPKNFEKIAEYRDAVSDFNKNDCSSQYAEIYAKQKKLLEIKAKYWAGNLKNTNFSFGSLKRNPGTEIRDENLRARFYSLIKEFYNNGNFDLNSGEREELKALFMEEAQFIDKCGI